jgi:hypothetical protein
MFKYFSIVSSHEKKCGCIQVWIIDIAGLHLGTCCPAAFLQNKRNTYIETTNLSL